MTRTARSPEDMPHTKFDNSPTQRGSHDRPGRTGFTLIEVMTALAILALVTSSVMVVIDRCVVSVSDSSLRMEAFELARENMEKVLSAETVEENVDFGISEKYPDVTWQTVVEGFSEPVSGKTWIRAVCSAEYPDSSGEKQTIKLEHWITELTDQQANLLSGESGSMEELKAEQLLTSAEDAATYAGVDAATIEKWVEAGLVTMEDGGFLKYNLDIFVRTDGKPTAADKKQQVDSLEELAKTMNIPADDGENGSGKVDGASGKDATTGLSEDQVEKMGVGGVMKMLKDRKKK